MTVRILLLWGGTICLLVAVPAMWATSSGATQATVPSASGGDEAQQHHELKSETAGILAPVRERLLVAQETPAETLEAADAPPAEDVGEPSAETGLRVGVVDFDVVREGWPVLAGRQQELRQMELLRSLELKYCQGLLLLTEDEAEEAVSLWRKVQFRTAAEQEKRSLQDLEDKNREREQEFQGLVQKGEALTDTEKERFGFLKAVRNERLNQIEQLRDAYDQELAGMQRQLQADDRIAGSELRKAAQRVAERRGLDLVLTTDAALFGGLDISEEIVQDLQQKVPELPRE